MTGLTRNDADASLSNNDDRSDCTPLKRRRGSNSSCGKAKLERAHRRDESSRRSEVPTGCFKDGGASAGAARKGSDAAAANSKIFCLLEIG